MFKNLLIYLFDKESYGGDYFTIERIVKHYNFGFFHYYIADVGRKSIIFYSKIKLKEGATYDTAMMDSYVYKVRDSAYEKKKKSIIRKVEKLDDEQLSELSQFITELKNR